MADAKISDDPSATLVGTELIPVVQSGANKHTTPNAIAALASSGAPTAAEYVTTASDGTLSAEVVIPGLAGSPDRKGIGGGGISEEYDTSTTGLTLGTGINTIDSDTTVPSHLYCKMTASATADLATRSWTPGSGAFDARCKMATNGAGAHDFTFGMHIGDSDNSNRLAVTYTFNNSGRKWIAHAYTYASATYTARGSDWDYYGNEIYFRITRDGSNNVSFWFSADGILWRLIATQAFTLTVANIGYFLDASGTGPTEMISDWLRTDV